MAYRPDSQRDRSTSLQRCEQNGRKSGAIGLLQFAHFGMRGCVSSLSALSCIVGGSLSGAPTCLSLGLNVGRVHPAVMDRKAFAGEQLHDLGQRQADDIRIGAIELLNEATRKPLDGIAASFAAPFT